MACCSGTSLVINPTCALIWRDDQVHESRIHTRLTLQGRKIGIG